jgi:tryptophan synthase alpha chain
LCRGLRFDDVLGLINQLRDLPAPLVGMLSYSLVHHRGPERFLADAVAAGLSGAIVPDLPLEEGKELADLARRQDFKLIQLVTPATPQTRAAQIVKSSAGFVYCVSVAGITGERDRVPAELLEQLRWLRTQTDLPLCVGFGISRAEHVRVLRDEVDGIIVGSALVRRLEQIGPRPAPEIVREVGQLATDLMQALNS